MIEIKNMIEIYPEAEKILRDKMKNFGEINEELDEDFDIQSA